MQRENLKGTMALAESPRDEFVARGLQKLKNTKKRVISNILTKTLYELPVDCANQTPFSLSFSFFLNFLCELFFQLIFFCHVN